MSRTWLERYPTRCQPRRPFRLRNPEPQFNPLEGRIRLLSLKGQPEQQISVKGWAAINSLDWAADGKSLFVSSQTPTSTTLLRVDLLGLATPLWDQRGSFRTWAIVAPNCRHDFKKQRLDNRKLLMTCPETAVLVLQLNPHLTAFLRPAKAKSLR